MKILVTGAAGFIGSHVSAKLIALGHDVVGVDCINNYYDIRLKLDRLRFLCGIEDTMLVDGVKVFSKLYSNFSFIKQNVQDRDKVAKLFDTEKFDAVCHLASQAGVRYSVDNPYAFIDNNIGGFITVLEGCRNSNIAKLIYASSSSVYGNSDLIPFTEDEQVDTPVSLYAATKKANELMAYSYSHLYGIETIGLRFFTVYGPWGRPDMAPFKFTQSILKGIPIEVYNNGEMYRDFTYIDDVVEAVIRLIMNDAADENAERYQIFNVGNNSPVKLTDFIKVVEQACDEHAIVVNVPIQPGDVQKTFADISKLKAAVNFAPRTTIKNGMAHFVRWFKMYYKIRDSKKRKVA